MPHGSQSEDCPRYAVEDLSCLTACRALRTKERRLPSVCNPKELMQSIEIYETELTFSECSPAFKIQKLPQSSKTTSFVTVLLANVSKTIVLTVLRTERLVKCS